MEDWNAVDLDPRVFTFMIQDMGVRGLQAADVENLNADYFKQLRPIYGIIFGFPFNYGKDKVTSFQHDNNHERITDTPSTLWFAKQRADNFCPTNALLSILLNLDMNCIDPNIISLGSFLKKLKDDIFPLSPEQKGNVLAENYDRLHKTQNSFDPPHLDYDHIEGPNEDLPTLHDIAFVQSDGREYKLDGLGEEGPIDVGVADDTWTATRTWITKKINNIGGVSFGVLVVTTDKVMKLEHILKENRFRNEEERSAFEENLRGEVILREQFEMDRKRRAHNYVPFIMLFLKKLAAANKLSELIAASEGNSRTAKKVRKSSRYRKEMSSA